MALHVSAGQGVQVKVPRFSHGYIGSQTPAGDSVRIHPPLTPLSFRVPVQVVWQVTLQVPSSNDVTVSAKVITPPLTLPVSVLSKILINTLSPASTTSSSTGQEKATQNGPTNPQPFWVRVSEASQRPAKPDGSGTTLRESFPPWVQAMAAETRRRRTGKSRPGPGR